MQVTNNTSQDYWFGPLHIGPNATNVTVDDTSATSLYLTDDVVADAINTLAAANKISVSGAALPFPRPTGKPEVLHGDGSPEGLVYAGQGSLYLRRDSGAIYVKTTGIHLNTGWLAYGTGPVTTISSLSGGPPGTPSDGDIWIATGVGSFGVRWMFQYDANETTASKWKFLGGPRIKAGNYSFQNTADSTWQGTGASIAVVRAGYYIVEFGGTLETTNAGDQVYIGVYSGTSTAWNPYYLSQGGTGGNAQWETMYGAVDTHADPNVALAASSTVYLNMWSTPHTNCNGNQLWLALTPVAIS